MDFNRREMEEAGWTFTDDGTGIPPSGEQSESVHVAYKTPKKREPMSPEIIQAIVDTLPSPVRSEANAPYIIGVDPSIRNTGAALLYFESFSGFCADTKTISVTDDEELGPRLGHLARQLRALMAPLCGEQPVAIIEGHYWQSSSGVSPTSIQTYCEAVGTCYGVLSCACTVRRVDPDWMPRILCGRVKGGTTKEDRHAIAEALLRRAGSTAWPSDASEHEKDALCLCVAYLVEEGWL